ncbi:MAG TPA: hypothetical protein VMI31_15855 [Fimbriimonadaceae bacterium]|nr:hypothetical protein [Fimbriimonadaceae bacterium]
MQDFAKVPIDGSIMGSRGYEGRDGRLDCFWCGRGLGVSGAWKVEDVSPQKTQKNAEIERRDLRDGQQLQVA